MTRRSILFVALVAVLVAAAPAVGAGQTEPSGESLVIAQEGGTTTGELRPRYYPEPPQEESWYNSDYIFAFTRGLAGSTMHPVAKAPLFILAIPLDIAFLPFTAIGGLFG